MPFLMLAGLAVKHIVMGPSSKIRESGEWYRLDKITKVFYHHKIFQTH